MRDRTRAHDCGLPRAAALSFAVYTRAERRTAATLHCGDGLRCVPTVALRQEVPTGGQGALAIAVSVGAIRPGRRVLSLAEQRWRALRTWSRSVRVISRSFDRS